MLPLLLLRPCPSCCPCCSCSSSSCCPWPCSGSCCSRPSTSSGSSFCSPSCSCCPCSSWSCCPCSSSSPCSFWFSFRPSRINPNSHQPDLKLFIYLYEINKTNIQK